jgi:hypothetical protein
MLDKVKSKYVNKLCQVFMCRIRPEAVGVTGIRACARRSQGGPNSGNACGCRHLKIDDFNFNFSFFLVEGRVYWRKKNDVRHLGDLFLIFIYLARAHPPSRKSKKC